jgi:hypothetical protein
MAARESGFTTKGTKDSPGGAYKRNFNRNPTGRLGMKIARGKTSRSKSRG